MQIHEQHSILIRETDPAQEREGIPMSRTERYKEERDQCQRDGVMFLEGSIWQCFAPDRASTWEVRTCDHCLRMGERQWYVLAYTDVVLSGRGLEATHVRKGAYCCSEACATAFREARQRTVVSQIYESKRR